MPVTVKGSGGGGVTLDAGAAASNTTLTLPNTTGTVALTASPTFTGTTTFPGSTTVDSSGNVGIGTSSPAASLAVVKQTTALSGTGNSYGLYMYPTSSGLSYIDAVTGTTGNTSLSVRTYNNGTYYSFGMDNAGNLQFNSGYGSTATAYGCRAWVNFNGTGTVAIRGSGNVSSITDNGTGDYTVNFTTAMSDANYCASTLLNRASSAQAPRGLTVRTDGTVPTSAACRLEMVDTSSTGLVDQTYCYVSIFR